MSRFNAMLRLAHSSDGAPQERELDDEATRWVVLLTSGESTEEDHEAFRRWRDQSPDHAAALSRARTLWKQVGAELPKVQERRSTRQKPFARKLAMAASVALCFGLTYEYATDWGYDYATDRGERLAVRLPDGSEMVLAGDSAVNLRFDNGERRIELARGEAVFTAVHDDSQPFIVEAGDHVVRDIGTVFSVERGSAVEVVVAEGSVETLSEGRKTLLTANQGISLGAAETQQVKPVDAARATSWTQGRIALQDTRLEDILAEVRPHYDGRIFLMNEKAGEQRLSVVIDLARVEDWLTGLERSGLVSMTRVGSYIWLN